MIPGRSWISEKALRYLHAVSLSQQCWCLLGCKQCSSRMRKKLRPWPGSLTAPCPLLCQSRAGSPRRGQQWLRGRRSMHRPGHKSSGEPEPTKQHQPQASVIVSQSSSSMVSRQRLRWLQALVRPAQLGWERWIYLCELFGGTSKNASPCSG